MTILVIRELSQKITQQVSKIVSKASRNLRKRNDSETHAEAAATARRSLTLRRISSNIPKLIQDDSTVKLLCVFVLAGLVIVFLLTSTTLMIYSQGWDFHDSIYFWYVTLTTVGFGDYIPYGGRKPPSDFLTVLFYIGTYYLLFGLALVASLIQCISDLLQGRLPIITPIISVTPSDPNAEDEISPTASPVFKPTTRFQPGHVSLSDRDFSRGASLSSLRSTAPSVNLCITAATCGGALNGFYFSQDSLVDPDLTDSSKLAPSWSTSSGDYHSTVPPGCQKDETGPSGASSRADAKERIPPPFTRRQESLKLQREEIIKKSGDMGQSSRPGPSSGANPGKYQSTFLERLQKDKSVWSEFGNEQVPKFSGETKPRLTPGPSSSTKHDKFYLPVLPRRREYDLGSSELFRQEHSVHLSDGEPSWQPADRFTPVLIQRQKVMSTTVYRGTDR